MRYDERRLTQTAGQRAVTVLMLLLDGGFVVRHRVARSGLGEELGAVGVGSVGVVDRACGGL